MSANAQAQVPAALTATVCYGTPFSKDRPVYLGRVYYTHTPQGPCVLTAQFDWVALRREFPKFCRKVAARIQAEVCGAAAYYQQHPQHSESWDTETGLQISFKA